IHVSCTNNETVGERYGVEEVGDGLEQLPACIQEGRPGDVICDYRIFIQIRMCPIDDELALELVRAYLHDLMHEEILVLNNMGKCLCNDRLFWEVVTDFGRNCPIAFAGAHKWGNGVNAS